MAFPGLRYDTRFKITSPPNTDYNCIAWAFGKDNCWMWPEEDADGVSEWPHNACGNTSIEAFIEAFTAEGYELCTEDSKEVGTRKVALYCYPGTTECTHAARQLDNGLWTSKLGESYDIQHSTPYTIQGRIYGNVACLLCRHDV